MHLKKWFLWLCLGLLLAGEFFLFSANRQKDAALVSFRAEKQRADDLQAQLDSLKNSDAAAQGAEISRLRAENQDLPRLRNQVAHLQAVNQKLSQQLNAMLAVAQQQDEQLHQIRAAAREAQANTDRNVCINNLRQMDAAKQQWALENGKTADAVPTQQDLLPYFKGQIFPVCPSGGTYTIGAVGEVPTCSIPGHALSQ